MALSSNGWPALSEPPPSQTIPGTDIKVRVRPGDVATVLLEVARRFHAEVERLDLVAVDRGKVVPGDEWGWAYRPIRGQTAGLSNHAAGCALDLNATLHPRGAKGTFTRKQKAAMRRILAATFDPASERNVVRWGEDYSTVVDGQHVEINASAAAVARVAARIRAKNAQPVKPKPAPVPPPMEEEDDMKSDEKLPLGNWARAVTRDADGEMSVGELTVVQAVATAQTNETVHAMAEVLAAMQKTQQEMLAELRKRPG